MTASAGYTVLRDISRISAMGGDGTRVASFEATLLSGSPLTLPSRIQTIQNVQHSIKTNAGGATGLIWAAGTNDGEVDVQAEDSDGLVVAHVLVLGIGEAT